MKYIFSFLVFLFSMFAYGEKNTENVEYVTSEEPSDTAIYGEFTDELLEELKGEGGFVWGGETTIKFEDLEKILLVENHDDLSMIDIVYKVPSINLSKNVEEKISLPLEASLSEIEGIEHIYSESKKGEAKITVQFTEGIEYSDALNLVKKTLSISKNKFLPKDLEKPIITRSIDVPINYEKFEKLKTQLLLMAFVGLCQETGRDTGISKKLEAEKILQECVKSLEKTK